MKNLKLILLVIIIAFSGCKPAKYTQLGDGLFADIQTNKGDIIVKLHHKQTPVTVASFVSLAEGKSPFVSDSLKGKKFYDGLIFHRVMKNFMIQGGDPAGTGSGSPGYRFENEIVDSLTHNEAGILSMANSGGTNTNGSQFFITHVPYPSLDGNYSVFGKVVQGIEIVDTIANVDTYKGGLQKDRPKETVVMNHVEIIRNGKSAKAFDAVEVMNTYFEGANEREAEAKRIQAEKEAKAKEIRATLAAEFEAQKAQAETLPSGLKMLYMNKSDGEKPKIGQVVMVNYAGYFADGKLFDSNLETIETNHNKYNPAKKQRGLYNPAPMECSPKAQIIPGFREGLLLMRVGDKIRFFIPSALGYGPAGRGNVIPPNADLVFDVEVLKILER